MTHTEYRELQDRADSAAQAVSVAAAALREAREGAWAENLGREEFNAVVGRYEAAQATLRSINAELSRAQQERSEYQDARLS